MRERLLRQTRTTYPWRRLEDPNESERGELSGEDCKQDQYPGEHALQDQ